MRPGDKAGAELTLRGGRHSEHRVAIRQRFGSSDIAAECAKAILYGREVRQDFPEEVLEEARAFSRARVTQEEIAHRMDLRGLPIFTIDSARPRTSTTPSACSSLTAAATSWASTSPTSATTSSPAPRWTTRPFERATSIYYADKVIPMLPSSCPTASAA